MKLFDDTYDDSDIDAINDVLFYACIAVAIMVLVAARLGIYLA